MKYALYCIAHWKICLNIVPLLLSSFPAWLDIVQCARLLSYAVTGCMLLTLPHWTIITLWRDSKFFGHAEASAWCLHQEASVQTYYTWKSNGTGCTISTIHTTVFASLLHIFDGHIHCILAASWLLISARKHAMKPQHKLFQLTMLYAIMILGWPRHHGAKSCGALTAAVYSPSDGCCMPKRMATEKLCLSQACRRR